jgi:opacity protein-like surface antigen
MGMRQIPAIRVLARCAIAAMMVFVSTPFAAAQVGPVSVDIGAGALMPSGDIADRFDTGFAIPIGVTWNASQAFGIQFQYLYGWMGGPDRTINSTVPGNSILLESNHQMHAGTFNAVFRIPTESVSAYVLAGPGFYHRSVDITTPSVGFATYCDPWWYVCYPVAVSVDQLVGSRSSTDFGFNVGGGVTFGKFYIEVRYHYSQGPEFTVPAGVPNPPPGSKPITGGGTFKASGHYIPITAGFKF